MVRNTDLVVDWPKGFGTLPCRRPIAARRARRSPRADAAASGKGGRSPREWDEVVGRRSASPFLAWNLPMDTLKRIKSAIGESGPQILQAFGAHGATWPPPELAVDAGALIVASPARAGGKAARPAFRSGVLERILPVAIVALGERGVARIALRHKAHARFGPAPMTAAQLRAALALACVLGREEAGRGAMRAPAGPIQPMQREIGVVLASIGECAPVARMLARGCADATAVELGLSELLTNAIEHGNLEIGFVEKARLLREGAWYREVVRRQALAANRWKRVIVRRRMLRDTMHFVICDDGLGFDWAPYVAGEPLRIDAISGRGIHLAMGLSFRRVVYRARGNKVEAWARIG